MRQLFIRIDLLKSNDLVAIMMATGGNFFGNAAHFQHRGMAFLLGDKCSDPLHSHQPAFPRQFPQRAVNRHSADIKRINQFSFRRHSLVGNPVTAAYLGDNSLLHPQINGRG
ncbi:hypothetical protein D3C75_901510 [compost metagenome]